MKHFALGRFLAILAALIILLPIYVLIQGSLQGNGFGDYVDILLHFNIAQNFLNSFIISVSSVLIVMTIVVLSAFAFSKMDFPFKNFFYLFVLCGLMLPEAVMLVPLFQLSKNFGWINNYWAVIGPVIAGSAPFNLLIVKNYYDGLPNSLLESAMIDGCSIHRMLFSIVIPLSTPAIAIIVVWSFLQSWNEYMLPLVFLTDKNKMTVTVVPSWFQQMYGGDMPKLFASLVIIVIPVIVIYVFLQKFIVEGITSGAVKG